VVAVKHSYMLEYYTIHTLSTLHMLQYNTPQTPLRKERSGRSWSANTETIDDATSHKHARVDRTSTYGGAEDKDAGCVLDSPFPRVPICEIGTACSPDCRSGRIDACDVLDGETG
jgi:hypothetical protein